MKFIDKCFKQEIGTKNDLKLLQSIYLTILNEYVFYSLIFFFILKKNLYSTAFK